MTVSTTTSTVTLAGNGASTVFNFSFIGVSPADLIVTYTDGLGVATVLSPTVYTLNINAVPVGGLWGIGGTVTYPNTGSPPVPIAVGTSLSITRDVPYEQTVSINNQGAFYPQAVEQGLDLLELQIQQLETGLGYTIRVPVTDPVLPNVLPGYQLRAGGYLAFDANGQPIITTIPSGGSGPPSSSATTRRVATSGTASIQVLASDSFGGVSIYQTGASTTSILLPSVGGPYPVFDGSLNANVYPIHVFPPAGQTIQGQTQYIMPFAGQMASFFLDGTQVLVGA